MPIIYLLLARLLLNPIIGTILGIFLIIFGIAVIIRFFQLLSTIRWVRVLLLIGAIAIMYYISAPYLYLYAIYVKTIIILAVLSILILFKGFFLYDYELDSNDNGCLLAIGIITAIIAIIIWVSLR